MDFKTAVENYARRNYTQYFKELDTQGYICYNFDVIFEESFVSDAGLGFAASVTITFVKKRNNTARNRETFQSLSAGYDIVEFMKELFK